LVWSRPSIMPRRAIAVVPSPGLPSQVSRFRYISGVGRQAGVQYQLSRLTAGPLLHALALGRPKVTGLEYVPEAGPAILASNHLAVVDSFYLPLVISRPVVFPAKAEYFAPKNLVG